MALPQMKPYFSRFFAANPGRLHFAAHSHHYWPDVSFTAQENCWQDAATLADKKWDKIFAEVIPDLQALIAQTLHLPDAKTLCFSPNTHDFVTRLLSCLPLGRKVRILTTDSEFYSFRRQTLRLREDDLIDLTMVSAKPYDSFTNRLTEAVSKNTYDMIYFSHVHFNSGYVFQDFQKMFSAIPAETMVVMDAYHGFMALPTDLSAVHDRMFYTAGGYKYAMGGEGVCFLHAPTGQAQRPRLTGWLAEMDSLAAAKDNTVTYAQDGSRFMGATFDPAGLYRQRAVLAWLKSLGVSVADIHSHVGMLQNRFVENMGPRAKSMLAGREVLTGLTATDHAHFVAYNLKEAGEIREKLLANNIVVDSRGDTLRFGFGIYHEPEDIARLTDRLEKIL